MTTNNRLKLSERCLPTLPLLAGFFFSSCSNVSGHISDLNWMVTVAYWASFPTFLFPVRSWILSRNPLLKHTVMCLGWLTAVPNRIWFACSDYLTYCQWLIKAHLCCFTLYYRIHTETGWVTLGKVSYLLSRNHKNVGVSFPSEYWRQIAIVWEAIFLLSWEQIQQWWWQRDENNLVVDDIILLVSPVIVRASLHLNTQVCKTSTSPQLWANLKLYLCSRWNFFKGWRVVKEFS